MKQNNFKHLVKQFIWTFFDYIIKIIMVSSLWFLFSIPLLYTVFVLVYSKIFFIPYYIVLFVMIQYSPVSFGASYYILQIVSQSASSRQLTLFEKLESLKLIKISTFFRGIFKYFFKSIFVMIFISLIALFLYYNIYFYWKVVTPKSPLLGLILTGFILWLSAVFLMMQNYIIGLLLTKQKSIFKAIYQSFLLVADNIIYTFFTGLLLFSFSILMFFTVAGIFLVFYGALSLLQIWCFLIAFQKYDETLIISEERRTFKDILKPWG